MAVGDGEKGGWAAPIDLVVEPLSAAAFRPFGAVIETSRAAPVEINEGWAARHSDLARIQIGADVDVPAGAATRGAPAVSIFRAQPRPTPIRIAMLERHPLGSQTFLPATPDPWLVVVAVDTGVGPSLDSLRCFRVEGACGVHYAPGVWHHPLLALVPDQLFWVVDRVVAEGGAKGPADVAAQENLEEAWFEATPRRIAL